jgi:type VI secretion system secreted protein VgrG
MDIRAGILTATVLLVLGAFFVIRSGVQTIQAARKLTFYRLRSARLSRGWQFLGAAVLMILLAIWLPVFGQPLAFKVYPPSPTIAPTFTPSVIPTLTVSPTITLTPTITDTPLVSITPTGTATPYLPLAVEAQFISAVTPNPDAIISVLQFSTSVDASGFCVAPAPSFRNPITHMYGCFQYDKMTPGSQWTALWYRNGELVRFESYPWNAGTGGIIYYTDWAPTPDQWLPGTYTVQIFVGHEFKRSGFFIVEGEAPTAAPTVPGAPVPTP